MHRNRSQCRSIRLLPSDVYHRVAHAIDISQPASKIIYRFDSIDLLDRISAALHEALELL